jgi:probable F420-dependent oxidoreductase
MKFSISIPTCREGLSLPLPFATAEETVRIALRAEELGYHSVWGNDHITPPAYVSRDYAEPPQWFEPLTTLAFIAGKTSHIKLGTAVLVLPLRDPVWVAKEVSTLDVFSGGRVILGVGVGAYREEFLRLRPRAGKAHRGEMLGEAMQVLNTIFSRRRASYDGKYFAFHDLEIYPKPLQNPFPLYSGGNNENEIKRAVEYGTGWIGASLPPERLEASIIKLRELAAAQGRDPAEIEIAPQVVVALGRTEEQALERYRQSRMFTHLQTLQESTLREQEFHRLVEANLIGTPQQVIDRIGHLQAIGVTMLSSQSFLSPNVADMLEHIQFFAEEVMPAFRTGPQAP